MVGEGLLFSVPGRPTSFASSYLCPIANSLIPLSNEDTHTTGCPALLLADDNPAVLATLVEMLKLEYRIVASLFNGVSVLDRIDLLCPDILMLDLCLGDLSGFDVARRLRDRHSPAKIIFLSMYEDIEFVTAGFDAGAFGYVFKSRKKAFFPPAAAELTGVCGAGTSGARAEVPPVV